MPSSERDLEEDIRLRQEKSEYVFFRNCGSHSILRVDKIPQAHLAIMAQHHVGVAAFKAKISLEPTD